MRAWFGSVVAPALEEAGEEFRKHGRDVRFHTGNPEAMGINVAFGAELDLSLEARIEPGNTRVVVRQRHRAGYRSEDGLPKPKQIAAVLGMPKVSKLPSPSRK